MYESDDIKKVLDKIIDATKEISNEETSKEFLER